MTVARFQATATSGRWQPRQPITTRKHGKSAIAAASARTTTREMLPIPIPSTLASPTPVHLGQPGVHAPSTGYIWDNVAGHELSYRVYGEFVNAVWCKSAHKGAASPKEGTPSTASAQCSRTVINKGDRLPQHVGD